MALTAILCMGSAWVALRIIMSLSLLLTDVMQGGWKVRTLIPRVCVRPWKVDILRLQALRNSMTA